MVSGTNNLFADRVSAGARLLRVWIKNYKSIASCAVELAGLTVLVGRNGSGKSNFLDAISFVADSLGSTLDHAIKARGGLDAVRRRSTGHPRNFTIGLQLYLPGFQKATYEFEIAARSQGSFVVKREKLQVRGPSGDVVAHYVTEGGKWVTGVPTQMPPVASDRLYLVAAAGLPEFRPVYDAIEAMGFYNLNPQAMKAIQDPDAGELLRRDGGNIASVIGRMRTDKREAFERIKHYLRTIVPAIDDLDRVSLGPKETLEFKQRVKGARNPWRFYAQSMSDGTLRALGALVAVNQLADRKSPVTLVGIEEPETALHPAAAGALIDALREAARHTQVVVTTHSPDLLDHVDLDSESLLVVQMQEGVTRIATVDDASRCSIQDHLYTPGELLRMDQLEPDPRDIERQKQMLLFDDEKDLA